MRTLATAGALAGRGGGVDGYEVSMVSIYIDASSGRVGFKKMIEVDWLLQVRKNLGHGDTVGECPSNVEKGR